MKRRTVEHAESLLGTLVNYIAILSLWWVIECLTGAGENLAFKCFFLAISVGLYFIRYLVDKLVWFTLIHIAVLAGCILIPQSSLAERIIVIIFSAFTVIKSFVGRVKTDDPSEIVIHPAAVGIMMFAEMLLLNFQGYASETSVICKLSLAYVAFYLIRLYLRRILWFDFINSKVIDDIPTGKTLKTGLPLVGGMSLFFVVSALLCLNESLIRKIGAAIWNWIVTFMHWLFSFVPEGTEEEIAQEYGQTQQEMDYSGLIEGVEETEPSKFLLFLEKIAIYLVVIVVVAGIFAGLVYLVLFIIRKFKGREEASVEVLSDVSTEKREKIKKQKGEQHKREVHLFPTPSDRIRKMYVKLVRTELEDGELPEHFTVRTFSERFSDDCKEAAEGFAKLYEKARYSKEDCDSSDVRLARKYMDELCE